MLFGFRLQKRLPVGQRNLVIVGVNFGKGQKSMAVAAVIHEGCLERRFDARHLCQIDIAAYLFFMFGLEIEFFNANFHEQTTTRVSSSWEASISILSAM